MWQDESLNDSRSAINDPGASRARDWFRLSLRLFGRALEEREKRTLTYPLVLVGKGLTNCIPGWCAIGFVEQSI